MTRQGRWMKKVNSKTLETAKLHWQRWDVTDELYLMRCGANQHTAKVLGRTLQSVENKIRQLRK